MIQLDGAGVDVINVIVGGLLYLFVYLTLTSILGAVDKPDIVNLRAILCKTRTVAMLANPVLDYEAKLFSLMGRD